MSHFKVDPRGSSLSRTESDEFGTLRKNIEDFLAAGGSSFERIGAIPQLAFSVDALFEGKFGKEEGSLPALKKLREASLAGQRNVFPGAGLPADFPFALQSGKFITTGAIENVIGGPIGEAEVAGTETKPGGPKQSVTDVFQQTLTDFRGEGRGRNLGFRAALSRGRGSTILGEGGLGDTSILGGS